MKITSLFEYSLRLKQLVSYSIMDNIQKVYNKINFIYIYNLLNLLLDKLLYNFGQM